MTKGKLVVVLAIILAIVLPSALLAQDVAVNLDAAKKSYLKGDFSKALELINSAKDQIENEKLAKGGGSSTYREISSLEFG